MYAVTILFLSTSYAQKAEINNINLYIEQEEYVEARELALQLSKNADYDKRSDVNYYIAKALYEYVKQEKTELKADFETDVLNCWQALQKCSELEKAQGTDEYTVQIVTKSDGLIAVLEQKTATPYYDQDYESALKILKILLQIDPKANNYKLAAVCADALGQRQEALDYFLSFVDSSGVDAKVELSVYQRIIKIAKELKKSSEELEKYLDMGMKAYPEHIAFVNEQINLLQQSENPNPLALINLYEKVLQIDSTDALTLFNLGVIYYNNAVAAYNDGDADEAKSMWMKAKDYWERGYASNPSDADTKTFLNDVYQKLGIDKSVD